MNRQPDDSEDYKAFTIELWADENPENPREWSNLGKMVCFHRQYDLGDKHNLSIEDVHELTSRGDVLWLPLYLYDHSGITMRTGSFNDPWDSGQVGIIYVDYVTIRKEYKRVTKSTKARVFSVLENEVEIYDAYITGAVVGYIVKDERGEEVDSCWGFFITSSHWRKDKEHVLSEARFYIDYTLKERAKETAHVEQFFNLNP